MATINFARREIEAKIVYCGPALSGKTTNLKVLHDLVPSVQRGSLHTLETENDRTLFFDYIPLELGQIAGFSARFKLFSVPGQLVYADTRREVLRGADAVVFVADSSPDRVEANEQALVDLGEQLKANGLDLGTLPVVVQLNKRDVVGAQDPAEMARVLNPTGAPVVEAVASVRRGVLDTLYKITEIAGHRIRDNLAGRSAAVRLTAVERAEREADRDVVDEHLARVHAVRPQEEERKERLKAAEAARPDDLDNFLLEFVDRAEHDDEHAAIQVDEERTGDMPVARPPADAAPVADRPPAARPVAPPPPAPAPAAEAPAPTRPVPAPPAQAPPAPARAAPAPRVAAPEAPALPVGLGIEARVKPGLLDEATLEQVLGLAPGPDGSPVLEVVLNRRGQRTRHPLRLIAGEPPAAGSPSRAAVVVAAVIGLFLGIGVGLVLAGLT